MPCPHYKLKISSRGGKVSVVAQAAYQSGERLFDERTQRTKFYQKKRGIVYTDIMLPDNAPREYADRNTLWNAVEAAEKNWNAQLARRFEIALPIELPLEKQIKLIREHCMDMFVSKGMIADIAIHDPDPPGHNPHAHVMLTMRPMDEQGHWMEKSHRKFILDEDGNRIRDKNGKWKFQKVFTTDWDDRGNVEKWRHAWEQIQNRYLEEAQCPERISMKSYKRMGMDQIPTVHMGPAVTAMERRGIETEIGNQNRAIKETNRLISAIKRALKDLAAWLSDIKTAITEIEMEPKEVYLADLLIQKFDERKAQRSQTWNSQHGKRKADIKDLQRFANITAYLSEHKVRTVDDLEAHMAEIIDAAAPLKSRSKQIEKRIRQIEKIQEAVEIFNQLTPIHDEYLKIHWKGRKQKYAEAHKVELETWDKANRYLHKNLPDMKYRPKAMARERASLSAELDYLNEQITPLNTEITMIKDVRYFVRDLLPELIPAGETLTPERKEAKKESIRARLAKAQKEAADARQMQQQFHQEKQQHRDEER